LALIVGLALHYKENVETQFYKYPQEWFPAVSGSVGISFPLASNSEPIQFVGNHYPERNLFQIFIALTAGPRFALILLWSLLIRPHAPLFSKVVLYIGLLRTLFFGIWAYFTSTDSIVIHELFGIAYLLLTIPWTLLIIKLAPSNRKARRFRWWFASGIYAMWLPMVTFFILHKKGIQGSISFLKVVVDASVFVFWDCGVGYGVL
jgi:Frag1/DRAM/Sfk1 family